MICSLAKMKVGVINLSIISIHCMATSSFDGTCWIGSMPFSIACRHQCDQYLQFPQPEHQKIEQIKQEIQFLRRVSLCRTKGVMHVVTNSAEENGHTWIHIGDGCGLFEIAIVAILFCALIVCIHGECCVCFHCIRQEALTTFLNRFAVLRFQPTHIINVSLQSLHICSWFRKAPILLFRPSWPWTHRCRTRRNG